MRGIRAARAAPEEELARLPPEELAARLRAVDAVTSAALANLRLEPLLAGVLERVREGLGSDTATVLLSTEEGEALEVCASLGLEDEVGLRTRLDGGSGIAGAVAREGLAVIVDGAEALEGERPAVRRHRAMMVAPLVAAGVVVGVMHVGSLEERRFTEAELAVLQVAGGRVAMALERARRYEEERSEARGDAALAVRAKSEFLAVVSHELRTPLAAVMGYAELLRLGIPVPIPEEAIRQVERIEHAARHLLQLIEEILSFSRVEAGREEVSRAWSDVREAVVHAIEFVQPMATRKGLEVRIDLPDGPVQALTDADKVSEIVSHLLANALKFTREGEMGVRLETDGREILVRVHDTGVGIAAENRERVFEPFWQVDQGSTREVPGMGLGLSIARRLTRLLGGDLEMDTEVGRGTTVTVRLPVE